MKKKLLLPLLTILIVLYLSGCSSFKKRTDTIGPVLQEPPPAPSLNIKSIEIRSDYLKNTAKNENLDSEEMAALNTLLNAYNSAKIFLSHELTKSQQTKVIKDLFNSIAILDYRYFSKLHLDLPKEKQGSIASLAERRKRILESFVSDDFKGVVNQCRELEQNFGEYGFTQEIYLVYILSLGKEGRLTEAVNLGRETLRKSETIPDLIYLKVRLVEWDLLLGNGEEALNLYDRLTDELDSKAALISALRNKIIELDRPHAHEQQGKETENSVLRGGTQEIKSVQEVLQEANDLAQNHEFKKAKRLLASYKNKAELQADIDLIERSIDLIELAEQESNERQVSLENRKKETIDLARNAIEKEEFEKAIAMIDRLMSEGVSDSQLHKLREKAVEKFINRERNRAADLFLSAKNTKDPEEKKKYLLESRKILNAIINRFPASELNERLKSHLNAIENEMKKL
jgi:hypothetical protein